MTEIKEVIELLEKVVEAQYQKVDGYCPWCGAKDYPVCGDKQGYSEVKPEDAEEWQIDHSEDCIVVYIDQALALLRAEQPPASDLTKEIRRIYGDIKCPSGHIIKGHDKILELCDRLDTETQRADKAEAENRQQQLDFENIEASVCPEDVGFVEYIKQLKAKLREKTIALANELDDCKPYSGARQMRKALEAKLKEKDELLFAYESVNAPVNPLLSINKELLVASEDALKKLNWPIYTEREKLKMKPCREKLETAIKKAKK